MAGAPTKRLALARIRLDGGTQSRAALEQDVVEEYAEAFRSGAQLPPVEVFYDGREYWLADGFHRVSAAALAEQTEIEAKVLQGTQEDAIWASCGANATHGLRRSNADKRRSVERALRHPRSAGLSDRQLGEHCGVSYRLVGRMRAELGMGGVPAAPPEPLGSDPSAPAPSPAPPPAKRQGQDGRAQDTSGIAAANRMRAGKVPDAARLEKAILAATTVPELEQLWGEVAAAISGGAVKPADGDRLSRVHRERAKELRQPAPPPSPAPASVPSSPEAFSGTAPTPPAAARFPSDDRSRQQGTAALALLGDALPSLSGEVLGRVVELLAQASALASKGTP